MRCPTLTDLPAPPPGKTGWPWTEESPQLPDTMPDGRPWPRITVVSPSYNQARFIEECIRSVLLQGYPDLEYVIMDGGSRDGSVEIIKKYEEFLAYWVSQKDEGQSNALNRGFDISTGDILAWLNSDDVYLPGALHFMAHEIDIAKPELVYGNCFRVIEGKEKVTRSDVVREGEIYDLFLCDYIQQPSSAWTRRAWDATGYLNEKLKYAFDWDWFIRAWNRGVNFKARSRYLSIYRIHETHKTATGGAERLGELAYIYKTYSGKSYERLFWACFKRRLIIAKLRRLFNRIGLSKAEIAILKVIFPKVFHSFDEIEIRSVLAMAGAN